MNPLMLIGFVLIGGTVLLAARSAQAAPRIPVTVLDPITGREFTFDPYVEVNTLPPGERMTDAQYNELLRQAGYNVPGDTGALPVDPVDPFEAWGAGGPWGNSEGAGSAYEDPLMGEKNLIAFLALIRELESKGDYFALVGGGRFSDTSDHPAKTGWPGIRRADDGRLTTAAGAYQITRTTWNGLKNKLGLLDFSPASQDAAAVELLVQRRAYDDVIAGNFDRAVSKLVNEWEAFQRILSGDYHFTIDSAKNFYAANGGALSA